MNSEHNDKLDHQIDEIIKEYEQHREKKKSVAFNVFNLSSYNNHLENFHSDIIATLLNPKGEHQLKAIFLHAFINYLKNSFRVENLEDSFNDAKADFISNDEDQSEIFSYDSQTMVDNEIKSKEFITQREKKRIDVCLLDEVTESAIIIENKINGAKDEPKQLFRYYNKLKGNYEVRCIIYLTIDGIKFPNSESTLDDKEVKDKVIRVGAFTGQNIDLVNGWLEECKKRSKNEDSSSFIHQYIKLIKFLAWEATLRGLMEKLRNIFNTNYSYDSFYYKYEKSDLIYELTKFRRNELKKSLAEEKASLDVSGNFKYNEKFSDYVIIYYPINTKKQNKILTKFKIHIEFEVQGSAKVICMTDYNDNLTKAVKKKLAQDIASGKVYDENDEENDDEKTKKEKEWKKKLMDEFQPRFLEEAQNEIIGVLKNFISLEKLEEKSESGHYKLIKSFELKANDHSLQKIDCKVPNFVKSLMKELLNQKVNIA